MRIPLLLSIPGLLLLTTACDAPEPPVPSDKLVTPYQIIMEYSVEAEGPDPAEVVARARLYDVTQAYDVFGNAGTVELVGEDAVFADDVELDIETRTTIGSTLWVDYSQAVSSAPSHTFEMRRSGDERIVSTINVVGLRMADFLDIEEAPADFAAETTEARIARRFDKWTPTRFTNPQLAASNFGPH